MRVPLPAEMVHSGTGHVALPPRIISSCCASELFHRTTGEYGPAACAQKRSTTACPAVGALSHGRGVIGGAAGFAASAEAVPAPVVAPASASDVSAAAIPAEQVLRKLYVRRRWGLSTKSS